MLFDDRAHAGRLLAQRLEHLRDVRPVILALPRGGVPVAREVADALNAPLDIVIVRKIGSPFQPELGLGAVGEGGVVVLNPSVVAASGADAADIAAGTAAARNELEERRRRFRDDRPMIDVAGRTAIVVDDGIATGGTARAAVRVVRALGATRVVLAVPIAPRSSVDDLVADADEIIVLETPHNLFAVGTWYRDFHQLTDREVLSMLDTASS